LKIHLVIVIIQGQYQIYVECYYSLDRFEMRLWMFLEEFDVWGCNRHMEFRSKQMLSAGNKILKYYRTVVVKKTEGLFESGGEDAKGSPLFVNLPLLSNNPKVFFGSWGTWGFITLYVYFEEDWFQALWRRFLFCFSFGYFI